MWAINLKSNKIQLAKLIMTVITVQTQLKIMETNTKGLMDLTNWTNILKILQQLAGVTRAGYEISYGNQYEQKNFEARHKGYKDYLGQKKKDPIYFDKKYDQWSNENSKTIAEALRIANKQHTDFKDENSTLTSLTALSESAKGRMQAFQIGNLIAAQQVEQLQKLRQLTIAQIQMQSAYMGNDADKEALEKATIRKFYTPKNKTKIGNGTRF